MDKLQIIITGFLKGLKDSILGIKNVLDLNRKQEIAMKRMEEKANLKSRKSSSVNRKFDRGPSLLHQISKCCALNGGVFLASLLVFTKAILPALNYFISALFAKSSFAASEMWLSIDVLLRIVFNALWVVPVFLIIRLVNVIWFQDISLTAYKYTFNRPPTKMLSRNAIADLAFTLVVESLFLLQGTLAVYIPIPLLGFLISWTSLSLLYSFYAFEYKWFYDGWGLYNRLAYLEVNWYYFVGFGFPLQLITWLASSSYFYSGCANAVFFPFFLISSFEAQPSPVQGKPFRLPIFTPVVYIANSIFATILEIASFKNNQAAIRRDYFK